jgi:hypothetical protein
MKRGNIGSESGKSKLKLFTVNNLVEVEIESNFTEV